MNTVSVGALLSVAFVSAQFGQLLLRVASLRASVGLSSVSPQHAHLSPASLSTASLSDRSQGHELIGLSANLSMQRQRFHEHA